jgi:hypothetical protein
MEFKKKTPIFSPEIGENRQKQLPQNSTHKRALEPSNSFNILSPLTKKPINGHCEPTLRPLSSVLIAPLNYFL